MKISSDVIERGEGPYIFDVLGNRYIDAVSSWWVNLSDTATKESMMQSKGSLTALNM